MPSSLNVQPAKRADAASLAAHAYRFGSAEDHVDRDRTHLNQVLHGPATFEATRAGIDALPDKQPNGRKIRTDANYTAQLICTFPEELDESQLDEWARETVAWAKDQAPGQLMYAVMHLDEGRPHIHMGIAAVEESGKLNYRALFGRESLNDPGENLLAMQKTYAARIAHLAVEPTQGKEYEHTGMNAWRLLKAKEEGRQEKAAELERAAAELNAEKSKNQALSQSLETARQTALTVERERQAQKKRADTAESERKQAQQAPDQQQASLETLGQHNTKASADLKTLKPPKRYTQEDRAKQHAAKASELDDLLFDDTEKATPEESGQTENKEDHQDSKAELQDKTKTPREKEEAGGELLTSLRQRAAAAEQERDSAPDQERAAPAEQAPTAPSKQDSSTLIETETETKLTQAQNKINTLDSDLYQVRHDNTSLTDSNNTLQSDLTAEQSNHRATQETNLTLNNALTLVKSEQATLVTKHTDLDKKHTILVTEHNNLLDQCRPWLNLVKLFVKDGLLNAQKVLKSGMIIRDIWDKIGSKVMDDPNPQPEQDWENEDLEQD